MIVVDTSALLAIVLDEPEAEACIGALLDADGILISAGTMAEALIVARRRNRGEEVAELLEDLGFEISSVTTAAAKRVAAAYDRWGKGIHPAGLNFGDCFAYELAKSRGSRLLFRRRGFRQDRHRQRALVRSAGVTAASGRRRAGSRRALPGFPLIRRRSTLRISSGLSRWWYRYSAMLSRTSV